MGEGWVGMQGLFLGDKSVFYDKTASKPAKFSGDVTLKLMFL